MPEAAIQFLDLGESLRQDQRGFVYFPFQNLPETLPRADMCLSCHLVAILPGERRGQHRHPDKTEWLYTFHGTGTLFWRTGDGQLQERFLEGNRTLVIIPPDVPHTLRNDGSQPLYLLAWRAGLEPGPDGPDTVPEPLLNSE